jgi:hypothetical protein
LLSPLLVGGKRLMERPVNQLLADLLPLILPVLGNENWTRRWDGADRDVLISQEHSAEDDTSFEDILSDVDQLHLRGRQTVSHRTKFFGCQTLQQPPLAGARRPFRPAAWPVPVAARTNDIMTDPRPYGFDATVEFLPHQVPANDITTRAPYRQSRF